ncbi:DUF2147 domain-containing protein [Rhodoblastus sp.]|uniref:DUF2147 domain-containing protein n=1 Tax=Rhodoblastus sp. TaxID=1962975 RepID=UPI003F9C7BD1
MRDLSGIASVPPRPAGAFQPRLRLVLGLAAMLAAVSTGGFAQTWTTAAGFWQSSDDDGKPTGWFYFVDKNGVFEGRLVKTFRIPGKPTFDTCGNCPGAQKDAPMLGLTIVKGMKREGAEYRDGTILDPRDGTVYHAQMELSPDGKSLFVRGYVGMPILGQTKTWTRLPDNVIAAADIPPDSVAAKAAPKPKPSPNPKPATAPASAHP